ncbi:MAG TPA: alpha-amylase family glycosyl hydrolase [Saprospiraceae bacterium]|nr:alpha-amylase family glycosyl hydrolase [Saprospiraceae bacterium]
MTITYNSSEGNAALATTTPVYAHMGVITDKSTSPSDWKYVKTTWAVNDANATMQNAGMGLWTKTFNIKNFFNPAVGEKILKLAFVFRNANGTVVGRAADGSDIFYEVYPVGAPLETRFFKPVQTSLLVSSGTNITVQAGASKSSNMRLLDNGAQIATATGTSLSGSITATATGTHVVQFIAEAGAEKDTSTFNYFVPGAVITEALPPNAALGITVLNPNNIRLVLYAPGKQVVHVIGDFNDWQPSTTHQMKRTPDGTTWWLDLGPLPGDLPIRFQYLVNGTLRIADPLSTLVLDRNNDPFIPASTYPALPVYPAQTSGSVSLLYTDASAFNWTATNYQRPKKTDLVIYELLVRDFVANHDYQTILDSLDYLERLGITAIELMPANEFDGNISWGYNPAFHKALDKYYGTPRSLKRLIDACHKRGIAVILDVVFNQASGSSPLAQLYWDGVNSRPAADNPWLNPVAKHDFNVFNDFNHESQPTRAYVKNCLEYWLREYRVDGFRFDLSKGFTQKNTLGNVAAWGQYDATRIAIWKDYSTFIWSVDPAAYVILEHFADNTEEKELSDNGMMLWGNMHFPFKEVGNGFASGINADLRGISYKQRGWNDPNLVGYMESHDEERVAYECLTYGNSGSASYNIKTLPVYARRMEMLANIMYTVPGPKMLWQFGELAYDFSINRCEDGSINNDCRLSPKPIRWDYYQNPNRSRLYKVLSALLHLRKTYDVFETTDFQANIGAGSGRTVLLKSNNLNVHLVANVGTTAQNIATNFAYPTKWYEYYSGDSLQVNNPVGTLFLQPGEYRLYLDKKIALPPGIVLSAREEVSGLLRDMALYPNPAAERLWADFSLMEGAELRILLTDVAGRTVQVLQPGFIPAGDQHMEIELPQVQPGLYFLTIQDGHGGSLTKRWVKM